MSLVAAGARLLALAAATMVLAGFFAPWMDGDSAFELRSFSGFDFARLVRDFEITARSVETRGQITGTAVAIYLVPALAVNAVLLYDLSIFFRPFRYAAGLALLAAGGYAIALLALLSFLGTVPVNRFATVVGHPSWGFALTLGGAMLLGWLGGRELRALRPPGGRD